MTNYKSATAINTVLFRFKMHIAAASQPISICFDGTHKFVMFEY